jgi:hypothetical protein
MILVELINTDQLFLHELEWTCGSSKQLSVQYFGKFFSITNQAVSQIYF